MNIKFKILTFKSLLLITSFPLMICAQNPVEKNGTKSNVTLIKPNYDAHSILRNPLDGWVMYAPRTAGESYWDTTFMVPALKKRVKAIDYASACYVRTSWRSLNPEDGVYAWNDSTSKIWKLIKGAEKRGLPIAFRVVVDGRDQGQNTPQFVFDAGARYYVENKAYPQRQTPFPQDLVFKKYYEKFIIAFAKQFNDPHKTSFIDAYGLGKWGEAHNVIYEDPKTATAESTEKFKEQVLDWVTDLYSRNFTRVPLLINYHRLIGHPESWATANANSERLLQKAINKGYSLRHDAFGMTGYYQKWEEDFAKKWAFKRPIIMEGGWIVSGTHRYWIDPSGAYREGHDEDVRKGEYEASAGAHVNMMDFRAGGEVSSWFEKSFDLVENFISNGGYRLYPDQIALPNTLKNGTAFVIKHRWKNMGWGYCPNNIPQWNYKYKVAFALLDSKGNVRQIYVDQKSEPSNWLKDKPVSYDFKQGLRLAPGNYQWAVAIVDTTEDNRPGIKLAIKGEATKSGWVKLSDVQVR